MKLRLVLLLCVCAAFALPPASLAGGTAGLPAGVPDFSHAASALSVSRDDPARTVISLVDPPITLLDTLEDFESFQYFALPGEPFLAEDGEPAIPQVTRLYRIPNTGAVDLHITGAEYDTLEQVNPYPLQMEERRFRTPLVRRAAAYGSDAWYPPEVAVMSAPMIYRDFRVVQVTLYPVQVNPVTGQARVYRRLEAELVASDRRGENELHRAARPSAAFAALYRSQIANLDESALDEVSLTPGSYLIVCRDDTMVRRWADTLRTWKQRLGYTVVVDARQSWTASAIRSRVDQLYDVADPPLEFVCLMGDPLSSQYGVPTAPGDYDHHFAVPAGDDDLEDVAIGRLPASSRGDFDLIMAKLMAYERSPYLADPGWFDRAFLYAGTAGGISSNEITMIWARHQFQNFTGVDEPIIQTHAGPVSVPVIVNRLQQGVSYFLWRGTVVGEMGVDAAQSTNNGPRLPVVLTITCGTGDFNTSGTCVSESWILAGTRNALRGGVCGIGTATYNTHVQYNNTVAGGLVYNICNLGVEHLGAALVGAKAQLYAAFPSSGGAGNFTRWNNLMGEPSLSMWTEQPVVLDVTYPGTVDVGTRRVRPQVVDSLTREPVRDARIVLWKGHECFAAALTDAYGFADVPVTVNTPGTLTLTVSKRNHKPFLADILCTNALRMVALSSYTLDDDYTGGTAGNGNGILNPGETVDLRACLRNFGITQAATGITAMLSSSNPRVSVLTGASSFADLAPGDTACAAPPFRIGVSPVMAERETATLTFAVTGSGQTTYSSLRLTCRAGEAVFHHHQVSAGNGDGYLDPGETADLTVFVNNVGALPLESVSGQLHSQSSFVRINSGTAGFGTIDTGGTGSNSGNGFSVTASEIANRGLPAPLLLVLTTAGGFVDSVRFTLPLGQRMEQDPTGPDAYGYWAYENIDTAYEQSRSFAFVNASVVGRRLALNDVGEQPANAPTYAVAAQLPFPFRFYGQVYDTVTVCSNGWAALGNRADQDQFRNYPIPGQQAPDAMLAPFWDDLTTWSSSPGGDTLGVWDWFDAVNHRYVIHWKARGVPPYQTTPQEFEILLLDPEYHTTADGNGIIVFQYSRISENSGGENDVPFATVGIQAPGSLVGLQYRFNNNAAPGAAALVPGRSVVFTTETRAVYGAIGGVVVDAETAQPVPGVTVGLVEQAREVVTDSAGQYLISVVLTGTYNVRARHLGHNDAMMTSVVVLPDSTTLVNIAMLHPEISLSVDRLDVVLPRDPLVASFEISNAGNGPLDYAISTNHAGDGGLDEPWGVLEEIAVTAATGDPLIQGCEFAADQWWISGGGGGTSAPQFYRFGREGNFMDAVPQPRTGGMGWHDLAWDGTLLYGSSGPVIYGLDPATGLIADTIPSPVNPARALAYDPALDRFWVADYLSGVYEIARDGTVICTLPLAGPVTGLAWNPTDANGYYLYVFGRDAQHGHAEVSRVHPVSGHQERLGQVDIMDGDGAGGCTVTGSWNSTLLVFAGIMQHPAGDRLAVWELDFNTTWISVSPVFGSVAAGSTRDIEVRFNPEGLRDDRYAANLTVSNNTLAGSVVLPVTLTTQYGAADAPHGLVTEYSLEQNYPNPFNSRTVIRYSLRQRGPTTLTVYNLLGQQVARLVEGMRDAGRHAAVLETGSLASGVYIYTLQSGGFRESRKLVLLR